MYTLIVADDKNAGAHTAYMIYAAQKNFPFFARSFFKTKHHQLLHTQRQRKSKHGMQGQHLNLFVHSGTLVTYDNFGSISIEPDEEPFVFYICTDEKGTKLTQHRQFCKLTREHEV